MRSHRFYTPWLLMLPALVWLALFSVWPAINTVTLSFTNVHQLTGGHFIGLKNYWLLWHDPHIRGRHPSSPPGPRAAEGRSAYRGDARRDRLCPGSRGERPRPRRGCPEASVRQHDVTDGDQGAGRAPVCRPGRPVPRHPDAP